MEDKSKLFFDPSSPGHVLFDSAPTANSPFAPAFTRHEAFLSLPAPQSGWVGAASIRLGWICAGQIGAGPLLCPQEQHREPLWWRSSRHCCSVLPVTQVPQLQHSSCFPLCCSQRTSRFSLRCYNLAPPGISPVHPCEDNRVFKAETAKEYIQESMIKATILCTVEHPSRKCTELVPQNNYMCGVHCKHGFYVHQHSWGQCLKI